MGASDVTDGTAGAPSARRPATLFDMLRTISDRRSRAAARQEAVARSPRARALAFWGLAVTLGTLLFASSAPSPLYVVYQAEWHFSALTLTLVFSVYVLALLAALLMAGSLSDRIGRRPVLLAALVLEGLSMVVFALAGGVTALVAARALQGVATGIAMGALSAALIDLQPPDRPHFGALVGSAVPLLGLATGAVATGLLVQYGPAPERLVFWLLLAAFAALALAALALPETVAGTRRGWIRQLRPRVGVPAASRRTFLLAAPMMVATWALGGLYLSLGPSIAVALLHSANHVTGGLAIAALAATGGTLSLLLHRCAAVPLMLFGATMLTLGVALTVAGLDAGHSGWFFAGSVLAGAGFGPGFAGAFRTVTAVAPAGERAGLIAAVYVLSYLAFSLPAIAAGVAVQHAGLLHTANAYGIVVGALAVAAIALHPLQRRHHAALTAAAT